MDDPLIRQQMQDGGRGHLLHGPESPGTRRVTAYYPEMDRRRDPEHEAVVNTHRLMQMSYPELAESMRRPRFDQRDYGDECDREGCQ